MVKTYQGWIDSQLAGKPTRHELFSKNIAVGSKAFVKNTHYPMKLRAIGRRIVELPAKEYQSRETMAKYGNVGFENLETVNLQLSLSNSIPWRQTFS